MYMTCPKSHFHQNNSLLLSRKGVSHSRSVCTFKHDDSAEKQLETDRQGFNKVILGERARVSATITQVYQAKGCFFIAMFEISLFNIKDAKLA